MLDDANEYHALDSTQTAEKWINITAKVVELWEPRSDAIGQVGLLGETKSFLHSQSLKLDQQD